MTKIAKKKAQPKPSKQQYGCSICFGNKKHKTKLSLNNKQSCSHTFCFKCIFEWIKMDKTTCPLCRKSFNKAKSRKKSVKTKTLKPFPLEIVFRFLLSFQQNMNNRQTFELRLREMQLEEIAIYRKIQDVYYLMIFIYF